MTLILHYLHYYLMRFAPHYTTFSIIVCNVIYIIWPFNCTCFLPASFAFFVFVCMFCVKLLL